MDKPYVRNDSCPIARALARHESRLLRYVTTLCRNPDTSSEIVQETFFKLCALDVVPEDSHLSCWLFRVARNLAIDHLRKETRMQKADSDLLDTVPLPDPKATSPQDQLEAKDQQQQVRNSVEALPTTQQEVVRLRFESGLSYKQISEITGQSVSHVGFLLHTAVKKLRQKLSPT